MQLAAMANHKLTGLSLASTNLRARRGEAGEGGGYWQK